MQSADDGGVRRRPARGPLAGAALIVAALAGPGAAAEGPVTHLPLPRFVSLKTTEGNVRRGPSLSHRIDWIFTHRDMPLRVTAEYEHWRRVEDNEGQGGWIYYTLLSGVRTVLFQTGDAALRSRPEADAPVVATAEAGVIGRLGDCQPDWCRVTAGGEAGWVERSALWGIDPGETPVIAPEDGAGEVGAGEAGDDAAAAAEDAEGAAGGDAN